MFKLRLEHSSKLHLSKQTMKRSTNYALLDEPWVSPEIGILGQTKHDCCDHPEIRTLRRTHCNFVRLHFASGLVISIVFDRWSSLSEHIATDSWRHRSDVTLLLKVSVSQSTHISYVVPEQLAVTGAGTSPNNICFNSCVFSVSALAVNKHAHGNQEASPNLIPPPSEILAPTFHFLHSWGTLV